jgi:hypothetical protein
MTDELETIWGEVVVVLRRHYPSICLQGVRKITKVAGAVVEIGTSCKQI